MARTDSKPPTTEVAPTGAAPDNTAEQRAAELKAQEDRLAESRKALKEQEEKLAEAKAAAERRTAELDARERAQQQRAQELTNGAKYLDDRQEELNALAGKSAPRPASLPSVTTTPSPLTPPTTEPEEKSVDVVNNSARVIGLPDGTPLLPGAVTPVPESKWKRMFGTDGKPVLGARDHFSSERGRSDLQTLELKSLPQLIEVHALTVVERSTDASALQRYADVEARDTVKAAIQSRLRTLATGK